MNFQQLKYVRAAVQNNLNLTEVANALYTSQSGVSKQIKELEAELGIEIFVRRGKRLIDVTPAGENAVRLIEKVLFETENLKRLSKQFTDQDKGRLVIMATHNQSRYVLPRILSRFTRLYPEVELELRQVTPNTAAQSLSRGQADIAVATEALDKFPELETYSCFSWEHAVVVPQGHPLTRIEHPTFADIGAYPVITYTPGFSGRPQVDAAFERAGVHPDIRLTAMDADVIKAYVEMGLGVGIVSEMALSLGQAGNLVRLSRQHLPFSHSTTKVAIQRGVLLRNYAYRLIEMLAPHLDAAVLSGQARRSSKVISPILPTFSARRDLHEADETDLNEFAEARLVAS
ncbi:MAG: LysR substrate-binding domain-containing protein [Asticcacaulis sp.]